MGLPTLENGPYIFSVNNFFSESTNENMARRMLLEIKNGLVALGGAGVNWQVVASSDASSVVNKGGGSPDLWADLGDLVNGTGAHSWVVLENQTTGAELCIDQNDSSYNECMAKYSPGGTFATDGTTSARPTDTDSISLWINSKNFCYYNTTEFVMHIMESADHYCTRVVVHFKHSDSTAKGFQVMLMEKAVDAIPEWTSTNKVLAYYNPIELIENLNVSTTPTAQEPLLQNFGESRLYARLVTSEPYEGWVACYPAVECYNNLYGSTATPLCNANSETDWGGGFPVNPIGIYRQTASQGAMYGRVRDLYLAPKNHDSLTCYPNDDSRLWIKFGCLLMPWNGTQPTDMT